MKKHIVQLVDDLDDGDADVTVQFAWKGASYEIDLSKANFDKMDSALMPYLLAARRVMASAPPLQLGTVRPRRDKEQLTAIRVFGRANGWPNLSNYGRIPREVEDAYNESSQSAAS